ncbi:calcineurin B homologous protein 1-like [Rhopilema esculentum]|uniref:calcineurin B homologous protein 1-like n=1 Tax=Rhopilema esculentum TaxID=499914 RepID=UPI0031D5B0F2|eukprot:gene2543-738_t
MGSKCSTIQLEEEDVREISKDTGFTARQIKRLYSRFSNLDRGNLGKLRREDFFRIPELAINPLGDRIVQSFFAFKDKDESDSAGINFKEFVRTLAYFRPIRKKNENPLNTRECKLEFAFRIYDIDGDGYISRQELLDLLRMMVGVNINDEQLESIADRTLSEADDDQDGFISFTEFSKMMEKTDFESKMSIRFLA